MRGARFRFDVGWATFSILALIALVVVPGALLRIYQLKFGFDKLIVVFGVSALVFLFACIGLATLLILRFRPADQSRLGIRFAGLSLAAVTIAFLLIYAGAFASNLVWGDTLNYQIVRVFISQIDGVTATLPLSPENINLLLAAIAGTIVVMAISIATALVLFANFALRKMLTGDRGPRRVAGLLGTAAILSICFCATLIWLAPSSLRGEPIGTFLKLPYLSYVPAVEQTKLAATLADRNSVASYPYGSSFKKKNVILIMSDSLRADRLGVYGYGRPTTPFLSQLYATGNLHRVDMALSTCSESYCGIASTLSSRPFHRVSNHNLKLHSLLRKAGYHVNFYLAGDHRQWGYLFSYYDNDYDELHDIQSFKVKGANINDDQNLIKALKEAPAYNGQPHLMYFFLMSSHIAGKRFPEYEKFQPVYLDGLRLFTFWNHLAGKRVVDGKLLDGESFDKSDLERIANRYDNGVLQADGFMKTIFETLGEKGYLKDSIVVFMGDHGDGLGERGHIGHTRFLYQGDIRIPLLIYDTEAHLYRNNQFATQIDIAPTILERLGLPIPDTWEGHSLLKELENRTTIHQTRRERVELCVALVTSASESLTKYIQCGKGPRETKEEFFDLIHDPDENNNIIVKAPPDQLKTYRDKVHPYFNVICSEAACQ